MRNEFATLKFSQFVSSQSLNMREKKRYQVIKKKRNWVCGRDAIEKNSKNFNGNNQFPDLNEAMLELISSNSYKIIEAWHYWHGVIHNH